jgi:hypothetical protein
MAALERAAAPPISLLEQIKRRLALYWCVGLLGLGTFLWTPVAALLRLVLPRRLGHRVGRTAARQFFVFYLANLRATGYARIDLDELATIEGERAQRLVNSSRSTWPTCAPPDTRVSTSTSSRRSKASAASSSPPIIRLCSMR